MLRYPASEVARIGEPFGLAECGRVLAVVTRLDPQEGHSYLPAACPPWQGNPNLRIILVGGGAARTEPGPMAAAGGPEQRVVFAFQQDVALLYALAELAALPSLSGSMPLSADETGAAGGAMAARGVDCTAAVVMDGETGVLVLPALVEGILRLLWGPADTSGMGQGARAPDRRVFGLERQISKTGRPYQGILDKSRKGQRS